MATKHFINHPWRLAWLSAWDETRSKIRGTKGRASRIGKLLGVRRQTISRWLHNRPEPPAWAYAAIRQALKKCEAEQAQTPTTP